MGNEVFIDQRPVVDAFDDIAYKLMPSGGATGSRLVFSDGNAFVRLLNGLRPRLTLLGIAVDSGSEALMTFHLYANGNPVPSRLYNKFGTTTGAPGITTDPGMRIILPYELPQGAFIEIVADLAASAATDYGAYARLRVEYVNY